MAGFGTALAYAFGGALEHGGAASLAKQREEAEARKAEKLLALSQAFQHAEGEAGRAVQREGLAQTAAYQKESLGIERDRLKATERMANAQNATTLQVSENQIQANIDLAKIAADNAMILNAKPVQVYAASDTEKKNPILKYLMPNGKEIKMEDADGNLLTLADTVDDTNEMKNAKALVRAGMDPAAALDRVLPENKVSKNWQESKQGYFKNLTDSASTWKVLKPEDQRAYEIQAEEMADRDFPGERPAGAPAAATDPATDPAAETTTTTEDTALPPYPKDAAGKDIPKETLVAQAKKWLVEGKYPPARIAQILTFWQIDPALAGIP